MDSTLIHVCLQTETAPSADEDHEVGDRWVCSCGDNFVYREGFNRAGYQTLEWWPAPAIPQPRNAKRRGLLFGPRKG
ncbi:hypothetical protein [Nocardioides sp.]|uniref:hypothetical protein n=1 Tax=Nocardioides sp. TaxID=35761 RepID=UPI00263620F7|nr:hypothetical protein [Nocardioides sp.]MCW2737010.1 hypothetical protein [Nocardioides sp.]